MRSSEISAYSQATASGQYVRVTGLSGKYDNVRVFWEDQTTRVMLRPHFQRLVERRLDEGRSLRLLDLGCGSGDGFETLTGISRLQPGLGERDVRLVPQRRLGWYTGVDINPVLLGQARERYRHAQNIAFLCADLSEGLPFGAGEEPYDVYFTSFGTLSHFGNESLVRLLADVARHAENGALVVGDWLGRYAYEWTELWDSDLSREKWMDYRISYIYDEEERATREIESFDLRLMCADEIRRILGRVERETGVRLVEMALFDRSLFVGRHADTGDYNPHCVPLRTRVNELHQPLRRTELGGLLFDLHIPEGFGGPADVLGPLQAAWNLVVRFTQDALHRWDASSSAAESLPPVPDSAEPAARRSMERIRRAIEASRWLEMDDPRSDLIEPQLGFALRDLEMNHQRGEGCGHGLVCVCEVIK